MSRRPFDPGEIDRDATDLESAANELERYAALTATATPRDLDDRVMAAVERDPVPRRGVLGRLGWPALAAPMGRLGRVAVLAAALVLVVGGVMAAGELARIIRDASIGGPSSSPTESFVPSASPSEEASPSASESESPTDSIDGSASPEPSGTPRSSEESGGASVTPEEQQTESPSVTASPTPKASQTSTPEETSTPTP